MEDFSVFGVVITFLIFLFTALLSWNWTVFFFISVSLINLHFLLPSFISLENGVAVHAPDVFFGAVAVATLIRLLSLRAFSRVQTLWLVLSLYLLATFAHGVLSYGLLTALSSYRSTFYLTAAVTYFGLFQYDRGNTIRAMDWVMIAGAVLAVGALILWQFPELRVLNTGQYALSINVYQRNRVLPAQAAQFAFMGALIALSMWLVPDSGTLRRVMALPLLMLSIFLFHRTVWIMLFAGILITSIASGRKIVRTLLVVQGGLIALTLLWILLIAFDVDIVSASVQTAVNEAIDTNNNTLNWRIEGWRILVDRAFASGPMTVLFGAGFGIGFERTISGSYIAYAPHNYYIELFLTSGLIGAGLFFLVFLYIFRISLNRALRGHVLEALPLPGVIFGLMIYSGSYTPQYDAALLLGLAISQVVRVQPDRPLST